MLHLIDLRSERAKRERERGGWKAVICHGESIDRPLGLSTGAPLDTHTPKIGRNKTCEGYNHTDKRTLIDTITNGLSV